jgi:hypothetical protein
MINRIKEERLVYSSNVNNFSVAQAFTPGEMKAFP